MNELIKALAVEADFMLCEDGDFYSEGQSQKITDGLQKFAELIVAECAKVCLSQRDPANLNYKPSVKFAEAVSRTFRS